MKTQTIETNQSSMVEPAQPKTRKWTRDEYYQMADLGWFQDQRVELIGGEIIEMAAQRNEHYVAISLVEEALRQAFGAGFWVRIQAPLHLLDDSAPEPDLAVVRGAPRDFSEHPSSALIVVEISDTTLRYDQGTKASLCAAAGIADYWIVNLPDKRLEVRRSPAPDASALFGSRYAELTLHQPGDSVSPLARPESRVAVADLLP